MNLIAKHLYDGLEAWKKEGGRVSFLKKEGLRVPEIFIPSEVKSKKLFVFASGFHLEETSGPLLLLDPKLSLPLMKRFLKKINVVSFPVINQYGLTFSEKGSDKYLRYNQDGYNYNTAWGYDKEKCPEVGLVENRLIGLYKDFNIVFVLSLHEDSSEPGKGYVWMNNMPKKVREKIQSALEQKVSEKVLLKIKSDVGLRRGKIERGFSVVDAKDESFENFMSGILGIPTLLSEAPFGLALKRRIAFHKAALGSIPL